jgi:hypothetical protein
VKEGKPWREAGGDTLRTADFNDADPGGIGRSTGAHNRNGAATDSPDREFSFVRNWIWWVLYTPHVRESKRERKHWHYTMNYFEVAVGRWATTVMQRESQILIHISDSS